MRMTAPATTARLIVRGSPEDLPVPPPPGSLFRVSSKADLRKRRPSNVGAVEARHYSVAAAPKTSASRARRVAGFPLDGRPATAYDAVGARGTGACGATAETGMIEKLKADLSQAMRQKDAIATATLRMLISQVQYARIEAKRELTQDDYLVVLQRAVKTRREAIEQYDKGGRKDLADKERAEIAVVERYLPAALTAEETVRAVEALLGELGITEKKDLGRAMKEFMARHRGRVDGKIVSALIAS